MFSKSGFKGELFHLKKMKKFFYVSRSEVRGMVGSFFHNVSYGRNAFGPFSQRFIRSDFRDVSFGRNESLR